MRANLRCGGMAVAAMLLGGAPGALAQPTSRDIQVVQAKMTAAQQYFAKAWSELFQSMGHQFAAPRVVAFLGSVNTGCGELKAGNGFFCPKDNAIYLDAALLATFMKAAAKTLGTDGDYAAIAVGAHEFGHAVAAQLNAVAPDNGLASEQAADCFAGVITRRAKTDKLLEDGDLAEGLFALANVGDDVGRNIKTMKDRLKLVFEVELTPQAHGLSEERQNAFLQGYYGGASFCSARLGAAKPPAPGRVITSMLPPAAVAAGADRTCKWSSGASGLRVRTLPAVGDQCTHNLLPWPPVALPDHVRIELTVTRLPNAATGSVSSAGLYYGDGHAAGGRARYGFGTDGNTNPMMVYVESGFRAYVRRMSHMPSHGDKVNPRGENRLTLDIHHEGSEVYLMGYVNGFLVGFDHMIKAAGKSGRLASADEAGVWVGEGFDEALVKDFRVMALPN